MKILLVCKGEYRYFFPAIARALKQYHGCQVSAVAFTSPAARMIEKGQAFDEVLNLAAYLRCEVPRIELSQCLELLRNLEGPGDPDRINTMVHADRIISAYPFERIIRILAAATKFWDQVLGEMRPDAVVGEVACATEWIGWIQAKQFEIPYLIPYPSPVANRFFFVHSPAGLWKRMECLFEEACRRRLFSDELFIAEEFVQNFRTKKSKPPFLDWSMRSPLVPNLTRITSRIARIPFRVQTWMEDGQFEVGSYHGTPPWEPIWQEALRLCRHIISEATIFENTIAEGPKVYFPLHVQPEFTTDVRAPYSTNQMSLIENISKSVPIEYKVVVKEHPGMKGWRELHFYRQLKKLHNVQLASPSVDGHELIQKSRAVLTITGSSAWEAILYGKPVIAFGPLSYGFDGLIFQCKDVTKLPNIFSEALLRYRPNHDLLLKFVWSFLASAYELEWGDPIRMPRILEKQNVENVARAIASEISSLAASRPLEPVLT